MFITLKIDYFEFLFQKQKGNLAELNNLKSRIFHIIDQIWLKGTVVKSQHQSDSDLRFSNSIIIIISMISVSSISSVRRITHPGWTVLSRIQRFSEHKSVKCRFSRKILSSLSPFESISPPKVVIFILGLY